MSEKESEVDMVAGEAALAVVREAIKKNGEGVDIDGIEFRKTLANALAFCDYLGSPMSGNIRVSLASIREQRRPPTAEEIAAKELQIQIRSTMLRGVLPEVTSEQPSDDPLPW